MKKKIIKVGVLSDLLYIGKYWVALALLVFLFNEKSKMNKKNYEWTKNSFLFLSKEKKIKCEPLRSRRGGGGGTCLSFRILTFFPLQRFAASMKRRRISNIYACKILNKYTFFQRDHNLRWTFLVKILHFMSLELYIK